MSAANLGEQLVAAMRNARAAQGDDLLHFPAFAVGYLEGILNDVAMKSPEARGVIEYHLGVHRAKVGGAAI